MFNITDIIAEAIKGDKAAKNALKGIRKGLYMIVFNPSVNIQENRSKGRVHAINAGETVLKPGVFNGGILERMKSYTKSWYVSNTGEMCFLNVVQIYLLADLTENGNYAKSIEQDVISIAELVYSYPSIQEKGSEYRLVSEGVNASPLSVKEGVDEIIANDKKSALKIKMYNLKK
jgi:hypothetical protein